jgi:hypothetical protein
MVDIYDVRLSDALRCYDAPAVIYCPETLFSIFCY